MVDNDSGKLMEPMGKVPLVGLGNQIRTGKISAWLMARSRELIPETRGSDSLNRKTH